MSLIQNFFCSLFFYFFLWVFGILMGFLFAHHKKFGGFFEMEVECVTGILMGLLIIRNFGFFFPRNGSHDLSVTLLIFQCNTDISVIYR